ncbi:MAG: glycerophosphodiester phosphodiesterase family protein [Bacteroidota bacterium]|nr:glycerophosphodiester phosphodiesterase family protein [Bacteroidota bacterium]
MKLLLIALLWVVLVVPMKAQQVKVIAHRGASSLAPENTLAAFKKAIDLGVDYLELDVWNTFDDSLIVIHDNTIERTTNGTGTVTAMYYFQIARWDAGTWFSPQFKDERIPTLRQVLALMKEKNAKAAIEIKNTNITSNTVKLIEEMGMIGQVYICCFHIDALIEAKKINPQASTLLYVDPVTTALIDTVKSIGGSVIGSGNGNTQAAIDYAHLKGIEFWPWTIDDSLAMRSFIDKKVDAVITNYPQVLLSILNPTSVNNETQSTLAPERFSISSYPNPFNASSVIQYTIPKQSSVKIVVHDILGKNIATLVDERKQSAGSFSVSWNAYNVPSGIYFIRLHTEHGTATIKSLLIK